MSQSKNPKRSAGSPGGLNGLVRDIQVAWQLFQDARVPTYAKVLPVLIVLGYIIFPVDLIPDVFLGPGQVDDLVALFLGLAVFRALVPKYIIQEYYGIKDNVQQSKQKPASEREDYIDAEYRVLNDDE